MRNRNFIVGATLASLLAIGSGPASAQDVLPYRAAPHYGAPHASTPGIDRRQAQQQRRIVHGARSGQLTRHEVRRLERQQHAIRRMEWRAKADGVVTPRERREIRAAQAQADRAIYRQKHDRQSY